MTILIAHRGNIWGPRLESENSPSYVDAAIDAGFDAEIDLWSIGRKLFLGHDGPVFPIDMTWLNERSTSLWVHCKNSNAITCVLDSDLNWFFHNRDDYTLTSKGFVWSFPGMVLPTKRAVAVHFGRNLDRQQEFRQAHGVCGDYVGFWNPTSNACG